jgi:type I restriction enzyme S subunit
MQWLNRAMLRLHTENTLDREEKIMSEWLKTSLIDIVELIGGGTPKTSKAEYWGGNINWLSVKDFNNENRYVYSTEKTITEEGLNNSSTKLLRKDDIIISARGTVGELSMIPFPMAFNQSCYGIRAKEGIDSTFLYYLIKHSVRKLKAMTHGSVFDTITRDTFANIDVAIPDIEMQQRVAKMLANIDDKVENNQRINNNLEQQAMALFKSWFIDFEPFDRQVPKTWVNGVLGDFVEIKRGGSPRPIQNFLSDSGFHWLKISDATGISSPFINEIKEYIIEAGLKKTVYLKSGSLVLSNSATPGLPKILDIDTCIHDGWLYFPSSKFSNEYLYLYFKHIRDNLIALGNGSVFTNLKTDILKNYPTYLPTEDVLKKFDELVQPIFSMILSKTREIKRLAEIRDTLLPKLMSGELDVCDIEL